MRHFIIEIIYTAAPERIDEIRPAHRAFLQTGYDHGWLLYSGPKVGSAGGIIAARASSLADLQAFFSSDPYHLAGAAEYRFFEFNPVMQQIWMQNWISGTDLTNL